jgi:hypothetical protein
MWNASVCLQAARTKESGFDSLQWLRFSLIHSIQTGSGAHPAPCPMGTRDSTRVKRSGREADHSPPFIAEVKNVWSYLHFPMRLHGRDYFICFCCFLYVFIYLCSHVEGVWGWHVEANRSGSYPVTDIGNGSYSDSPYSLEPWIWSRYVPPKHWNHCWHPHGTETQK